MGTAVCVADWVVDWVVAGVRLPRYSMLYSGAGRSELLIQRSIPK